MNKYFYLFFSLFFVIFLFLNFQALLFPENEEYQRLKTAVLKDPFLPEVHKKMSVFYKKAGLEEKSLREARIAYPAGTESLQEKDNFEKKISYWKEIVSKYQDFRDAYFQLALLYYQTNREKDFRENLQKTLNLDPNFKPGLYLAKISKFW